MFIGNGCFGLMLCVVLKYQYQTIPNAADIIH